MSYFSEFTLPIQKEKVGVSGSKDTLWEWQTNIQVCILRILLTIPGIFFANGTMYKKGKKSLIDKVRKKSEISFEVILGHLKAFIR